MTIGLKEVKLGISNWRFTKWSKKMSSFDQLSKIFFGSKIGYQKEFDLMVSNQASKKKHASLILAVYETMKTQIHGMSIE